MAQIVKNLSAIQDLGSVPGSGRYPEEGNDNPLQYYCLENSMDRGGCQPTVHGIAKIPHNWAINTPLQNEILLYSIVQSFSCVQLYVTPSMQHTMLPCPSLSPGVCLNSCPLSWWCHPTIFFCLQTVPASRYFPMSSFFASGGQSTGALASTSVLSMNIQD